VKNNFLDTQLPADASQVIYSVTLLISPAYKIICCNS